MPGAPVTCVMHTRVPNAAAYKSALEADECVRVVECSSAGMPADFICRTGRKSVAFLVSPTGTLAPEAAARAAKLRSSFEMSVCVSLSGVLPTWPVAGSPSPPIWIAFSGDAGDFARFMLHLTRSLPQDVQPQPAARPAPPLPTAAALVSAVAQMPGVPTKAAATALLCASGTLGDLASASPQELAAVGAGLDPAQANALAAAFQQPSPLVMHVAPVAYKIA